MFLNFKLKIYTAFPPPTNLVPTNYIPKPSTEQPQDPGSKRVREDNNDIIPFGDKRMRYGN